MFGNNHQPQSTHAGLTKEEAMREFLTLEEKIAGKFQDFIQEVKKHETEQQTLTVTIDPSGFTFDSRGFKYAYLVVSDQFAGSMINVNYQAIQYSLVLRGGLNLLEAIHSSQLTSAFPVVATIVYTNTELAVREHGEMIVETHAGTGTSSYTFTTPVTKLTFLNDSDTEDATITVKGVVLTIKAGEVFEGHFPTFTNVLITTLASYRMVGAV
jgi:hypothetical protein